MRFPTDTAKFQQMRSSAQNFNFVLKLFFQNGGFFAAKFSTFERKFSNEKTFGQFSDNQKFRGGDRWGSYLPSLITTLVCNATELTF